MGERTDHCYVINENEMLTGCLLLFKADSFCSLGAKQIQSANEVMPVYVRWSSPNLLAFITVWFSRIGMRSPPSSQYLWEKSHAVISDRYN